jgi:hypothetical protein
MRRPLALLVLAMLALVLLPGRASGTVEEQRARLPPAADCDDPVEGTWLGLEDSIRFGEWYEATLNIRRASAGSAELVGDMYMHFWRGGPQDSHPPACRPGGREVGVKMPNARGKIDGLVVSFGGTTYSIDKNMCGVYTGRYNVDHFSGTIDATINEFQSVNNDGGSAVNEPVVFRRIRCFKKEEGPALPAASVTPPAYEPPKRGISCGR